MWKKYFTLPKLFTLEKLVVIRKWLAAILRDPCLCSQQTIRRHRLEYTRGSWLSRLRWNTLVWCKQLSREHKDRKKSSTDHVRKDIIKINLKLAAKKHCVKEKAIKQWNGRSRVPVRTVKDYWYETQCAKENQKSKPCWKSIQWWERQI